MRFLGLILGLLCSTLCAGAGTKMCMMSHPQQQFCSADYVVRAKVLSGVKEEVMMIAEPSSTAAPSTAPTTTPATPSTAAPTLPRSDNDTQTDLIEVQKDGLAAAKLTPLTPPMVKYQEVRIERIMKGKDVIQKQANGGKNVKKPVVKIYLSRVELKSKNVLIAGKLIEDKLWVFLCSWCTSWKSLTPDQKKGLKKLYRQNCDCKVTVAYDIKSKYKSSTKECYWVPDRYTYADPSQDCGFKHQYCYRNGRGYCEMSKKSYLKCIQKQLP